MKKTKRPKYVVVVLRPPGTKVIITTAPTGDFKPLTEVVKI